MKLFKNIKKWLEDQEHLFYLFLFILIVPNIVLCFTEPLSFIAKVCNVLLPFGCYYLLMTLSRNCGKMLWILFLFLFLSVPDCVVSSVRAVHYCCRYVSEPGDHQFERSYGTAWQSDACHCRCGDTVYTGFGVGYHFNRPKTNVIGSVYPQRT